MPEDSLALEVDYSRLTPEQVVENLLGYAIAVGVSDLFLSTNEDNLAVSARYLGTIHGICRLPLDFGRRMIAAVKASAGLDVAERRRPQDGRWILSFPGRSAVDLRISILPTLFGEDVSFRILDRQTRLLNLDQLGLLTRDRGYLDSWLQNPSGLILVTGPTGAGKTTTLYACLTALNNGQRKLNTIEDPIEYTLEGVRQSQVAPKLDVGFPDLLSSVLRQSPDVIMIGEVRDPVTARTAVRAANSGHLVLATLHAQTAPAAINSMLNLDVPAPFLSSALLGVISQRLIRVLCQDCKLGFDISASPMSFEEVREMLEPGEGQMIYQSTGCSVCRHLGYSDRIGVFEVMPVSRTIRSLIVARQPIAAIRQAALGEGMIEFRRAALLRVAQGLTSIEELFRAIPSDDLIED